MTAAEGLLERSDGGAAHALEVKSVLEARDQGLCAKKGMAKHRRSQDRLWTPRQSRVSRDNRHGCNDDARNLLPCDETRAVLRRCRRA